MNFCRRCGQDFSSVANFDSHRVGKHEYLWSVDQEDGRRCLDVEELEMRGLRRDKYGRWADPSKAAATRLWATVNATEGV